MSAFTVAKYLRLSSEDADLKTAGKLESNSIANQRNLLDSYISRDPKLADAKILEFCDDGWSGTNFERPAVRELLNRVRKGEIGCIIVKDLSRFGRDYLEVGNYISRVFPFMGVRFIAVNDGFDSANPADIDSLETSFKTLLYDLYSRDLSRKVKSAKMARAKRGLFLSPFAPYGYVKDPENKNHLLIDPDAAETVREIFRMAGDGHTTVRIAKHLNRFAVPTPMRYKDATGYSRPWHCLYKENFWTEHTVAIILRDERYLGKNVYGKRTRKRVGHYHSVKVKREDWVVTECAHEGIVTREEFDRAQAAMRKFREFDRKRLKEDHILRGKVRCGICGHAMEKNKAKAAGYYCRTPRVTDAWSCPTESVPESDIMEILTRELRVQAETAVEMELVWREIHSQRKRDAAPLRKSLTALKAELNRRDEEIGVLYESLVMGEMSAEKYLAVKASLTQGRNETAARIAEIEAELDNMNQDGGLDNRFVEAFKKYGGAEELSEETLSEVLDCVLVYPDNRMEIIWNFQDECERLLMELGEPLTPSGDAPHG